MNNFFIVAFAIFIGIGLIAVMFSPIIGMIIVVRSIFKMNKNKQNFEGGVSAVFTQYAHIHGGAFMPGRSDMKVGGSFSGGAITDVLQSQTSTGNKLWVYYTTKKTVIAVEVPDIKAQFLIKSKFNDQQDSETNLASYKSSQKVKLEGNFSEFFNVYAPDEDQQDLLVLLAPDVMEDLLQNFAQYDIEVEDNILYMYVGGTVSPAQAIVLITPVQDIIQKMRLRIQDGRVTNQGAGPEIVARAATDNTTRKHLVRSPWFYTSIGGGTLLVLTAHFSPNFFMIIFIPLVLVSVGSTIIKTTQQEKLKKRYAEAINAHVASQMKDLK
jgi:hypothetical protein